MNIEPDIFDYLETTSLEPHDDYTSEITYKDQKTIWNRLKKQDKEIERLNNIIKEVREYIYKNSFDEERKQVIDELWVNEIKDILEILDKGSE